MRSVCILRRQYMPLKPVIFVSAASMELCGARALVAKNLYVLGYEPVWQEAFDTEHGEIRQILREKIDQCAGLIQLVGRCYGFEPPTPDEKYGRVSYTQFEALYARDLGIKVWYFLIDSPFRFDAHTTEGKALRSLQSRYRKKLKKDTRIYYPINSEADLERTVLRMRNDLAVLRRRWKIWAVLVLGLLVALFALSIWHMGNERNKDAQLLQGIRNLPQILAEQTRAGEKSNEGDQLARAYATLDKRNGLAVGTFEKELPAFADKLLARSDTSAFDRANALFVNKKYAEAEVAALQAKDKALSTGVSVHDVINAFELAGLSALEQIQYARALTHLDAAAALTDPERDPKEWADVHFVISYAYYENGNFSETERVLRKVIIVQDRLFGAEDPSTLRSRNNLAESLRAQGKYNEAEVEQRAVLGSRVRVLGAEDLETLISRGNLAEVLRDEGKYDEAEKEDRAVIGIYVRVLGAGHPYTLGCQNNLAEALRLQGKYAEAEKQNREVLANREHILGAEHPDTTGSRNNLAIVLRAEGRTDEAEKELRTCVTIESRVLGAEHPQTLNSRMSLANVLDDQGRQTEAEQEYRAVLSSQERVLGLEHPDVFLSCHNLAKCLASQNRFKEALEMAKRAKIGQRLILGENHPLYKASVRLCEDIEAILAEKKRPR